jgi:hypothetical protein
MGTPNDAVDDGACGDGRRYLASMLLQGQQAQALIGAAQPPGVADLLAEGPWRVEELAGHLQATFTGLLCAPPALKDGQC